jgi:hypothetical protein
MGLGLEWAFRLVQEPRRLRRRYLRYNPRIVLIGHVVGPRPPGGPVARRDRATVAEAAKFFSSRCQRRAHGLGSDAHRLAVDVAEHRSRAGRRDRIGAGIERE